MALVPNSTYAYVDLNDVQVFVGTDDITDRGDWSNSITYPIGHAVLYLGAYYYCLTANTNVVPDGNISEEWSTLALVRSGNPDATFIVDGTRVIRDYHMAWGTNAFNNEISAVNVPYSGNYSNVQAAIDALFSQTGSSGLDAEIANRIAGDLSVAQQGSNFSYELYVAGTNYANSLSQGASGSQIAQFGSQFAIMLRDQGTNYTNTQVTVEASARVAGDLAVEQRGSQYSTILRDQGTAYTDAQVSVEAASRASADLTVAQRGSELSYDLYWSGTNLAATVAQQGSQYATILRDQGTGYTNTQVNIEAVARANGDATVSQQGSNYTFGLYVAGTNFALSLSQSGAGTLIAQNGSQFSIMLRDQGTNYTNTQVNIEAVARASGDTTVQQQGSQYSTILRDQGTNYTNSQITIEAASRASGDATVLQQGSQFSTIHRDQGTNYTNSQITIEASARAAADIVVEQHGSALSYMLYWAGTQTSGAAIQLADAGVANDGAGLSTARVVNDLPIKRVKAGTNITIENNGTNVKIGIDTFNTARTTFLGPSVGQAGTTVYSGTVTIDFGSQAYSTISLAGNLYIIPTGMLPGRGVSARLIGDTVDRSLDFAGGVRFIGTRPTSLAANKIAIVSFSSYSNDLSNVVGAYSAET